jgi:hypothetical protein
VTLVRNWAENKSWRAPVASTARHGVSNGCSAISRGAVNAIRESLLTATERNLLAHPVPRRSIGIADYQLEAAPEQPSSRPVRLGGNELRGWRLEEVALRRLRASAK